MRRVLVQILVPEVQVEFPAFTLLATLKYAIFRGFKMF